jgi:hypothetical protein
VPAPVAIDQLKARLLALWASWRAATIRSAGTTTMIRSIQQFPNLPNLAIQPMAKKVKQNDVHDVGDVAVEAEDAVRTQQHQLAMM